MIDQSATQVAAADEAAAEWLLRHDGPMSDAERNEFLAWLAESPVNAAAWSDAQTMWASFDHEPDPLLASMLGSARSMRRPTWRPPAFQGAAMAASILLCLGVLGWQGDLPGVRLQPPSVSAAAGERYEAGSRRSEIALRDGSRVMLDAHSSIRVRLSDDRRDIELVEGDAFFRVAHDSRRPFVVAAEGRTVTATGTAFAVSVSTDRLAVVLEQGTVTVAGNGSEDAKLMPGQQFAASKGQAGAVTSVDVDGALAWRTGYVELHDATIEDAVRRMNRYASKPVVVGDKGAGDLRVTGRFRTDDPSRFVQTLSELYPVRIRRGANGSLEIISASRRKGY